MRWLFFPLFAGSKSPIGESFPSVKDEEPPMMEVSLYFGVGDEINLNEI